MIRTLFIASGLLFALAGCQSMPPASSPESPQAVFHFVAIWLKNPDDAAARNAISEQAIGWRDFPGVKAVSFGRGLPGERAIVQDYDLGVLMIFENEAALRNYEQDATHQQAVKDVLAPVAAKVMVFDFVEPAIAEPFPRDELRKRQYRHYQQLSGQ